MPVVYVIHEPTMEGTEFPCAHEEDGDD